MPVKTLLSAIMIVKNEEENLQRLLPSLRPVADEIVSVDTGSSDGTVALLNDYGARIISFPWNGNESDARNLSVQNAHGKWLWQIDADEEITPPLAEEIRSILPTLDFQKEYNSLSMVWENHHLHDEVSLTRILRVARNQKDFRYEGPIHPLASYKDKTYCLRGHLLHFGYRWDPHLLQHKVSHMRDHLEPLCCDEKPPLKRLCELLTVLTCSDDPLEFSKRWEQLLRYTVEERISPELQPFWFDNLGNYLRYFTTQKDFSSGVSYAEEALDIYPHHYPSLFYLLQRAVARREWETVKTYSESFEEPMTTRVEPYNPIFPDTQIPQAKAWRWLAEIASNSAFAAGFPDPLNIHNLSVFLTGFRWSPSLASSKGALSPPLLKLLERLQTSTSLSESNLEAYQTLLVKTQSLLPSKHVESLLVEILQSDIQGLMGKSKERLHSFQKLLGSWPQLTWLRESIQHCLDQPPWIPLCTACEAYVHLT